MPNHISNVLRMYASSTERMDEVIKGITRGKNLFDFNAFIPYPDEYRVADEAQELYLKEHPGDWANAPEDGYNKGGYEWCRENWGTKWNSYDHQVRKENTWGSYVIYFETAWSIPYPILEKFFSTYPDLEIDYIAADEGGGFAVHISREEGVTKRVEWDYKTSGDVIDAILNAARN